MFSAGSQNRRKIAVVGRRPGCTCEGNVVSVQRKNPQTVVFLHATQTTKNPPYRSVFAGAERFRREKDNPRRRVASRGSLIFLFKKLDICNTWARRTRKCNGLSENFLNLQTQIKQSTYAEMETYDAFSRLQLVSNVLILSLLRYYRSWTRRCEFSAGAHSWRHLYNHPF